MSGNSHVLDSRLAKATHVLEHVGSKIPKSLLGKCAGLVLIKGMAGGLGVSVQYGEGILVARRDEKWIPFPVAVDFSSVGAGAVLGAAEKDLLLVLNDVAMKRFVEGDNELNLGGADMGFAMGPVGRGTGTEIGLPGKAGLASSFVYTLSKGGLIDSEIASSKIVPHKSTNKWFYCTESVKDILDGNLALPDGSGVPELMEKIEMMLKTCS